MKYPHLAARLFNTPLLVHPQKLDAIIAGLGSRLIGAELGPVDMVGELPVEMFTTRRGEFREAQDGEYRVIENVAVVPVMGALVHRGRMQANSSYLLGYQDVARNLQAAAADPEVTHIVMQFDSPGGEATGAFELPALIRDIAGNKPVTAAVDGMAASAGYLLASAASQIAVIPSGYAGSIGVVTRHADFSKALHDDGIKITHIYAGAHKVDGNPYEPLPESVREDFQAEIDALYQQFVQAVAEHRGLSAEHVMGTQARIFRAQAAVDARLADRIATPDQLISELTAQRVKTFSVGQSARFTTSKGAHAMTDTTHPAGADNQPVTYTAADLDKARMEGFEQGKQAEAARVSGILAYADTEGRSLSVAHAAIQSGMSIEQAKAVMDAAPKAAELTAQTVPGLAASPEAHAVGPDPVAASTMTTERQAAASAVALLFGNRTR